MSSAVCENHEAAPASRKSVVFASLFIATALGVAGLFGIRFDSSLFVMLPDKAPVRRALDFLQEANYADKVALSFTSKDPSLDRAAFLEQVGAFTDAMNSPLLQPVAQELAPSALFDQFGFFLRHIPSILDERDMAEIARRMQPEALDALLRARYLQLLKPEGSFMSAAIRRDPLDLYGLVLQRLEELRGSFGYGATLENGLLVSSDGRHAMRLFETSAAISDIEASAELVAYLETTLQTLPDNLHADAICGHAHTVGNRRAIESDIQRMAVIATFGFLILFAVCFRDPGALWIFFMPLLAALLALNLAGRLTDGFSALVAGLGSVIAGIAVDYGIHVFVALRSGVARQRALRDIAAPVCLGALTTLAVFAALLFSRVAGYRQMGLFAGISIIFALGLALFVLPRLLGRSPAAKTTPLSEPGAKANAPRNARRWLVVALLVAIMALLAQQARHIRFNADLHALNGAGETVMRAQRQFEAVWSNSRDAHAFLVVEHDDYDSAERLNQSIADDLRKKGEQTLNFASLWPARERRRQHAANWSSFWNVNRIAELRERLPQAGRKHGFSANAFDPFFDWIQEPPPLAEDPQGNTIFNGLRTRFIHRGSTGWTFATWYRDTPQTRLVVEPWAQKHENVFIVAPRKLGGDLSQTAAEEIKRLSLWAALFMLLVTLLVFRNLKTALAALLPAIGGTLFMAAGLATLGHTLNVANVIALLVVAGLCIDYGIFMAHACRRGGDSGIRKAVTLSAATTLIGSGTLLFARHPALFSIGLTLSLGVAGGYAVALLFTPALLDHGPNSSDEKKIGH